MLMLGCQLMHGGVMGGGRALYQELASLEIVVCKFTSQFLIVQQTNVRTSRDWVDNRWVNIKPKPDILCYVSTSCISSASAENKFIKTMKLEAIEEYKPMVSSGVVDAKEVGLRKVTPVNEEDAKAVWGESENDVMTNVLHANYEDKKAISVGGKNGDGCDDKKKEVEGAATDNDAINEDNARDLESLSQRSEIA